jgi:type IV secretory pathway VirB10-like protein
MKLIVGFAICVIASALNANENEIDPVMRARELRARANSQDLPPVPRGLTEPPPLPPPVPNSRDIRKRPPARSGAKRPAPPKKGTPVKAGSSANKGTQAKAGTPASKGTQAKTGTSANKGAPSKAGAPAKKPGSSNNQAKSNQSKSSKPSA